MKGNIVFISNCELYKELLDNLLGSDAKYVNHLFSTCDAIDLLNTQPIEVFIVAHEFIDDSIQDFLASSDAITSNLKPIVLCDDFEQEEAQECVENQLFSDAIIARPLTEEKKLSDILKRSIKNYIEEKSVLEKDKEHNKSSILVIEDDDFFIDVYKNSLANLNINIIFALDCETAAQAIYEHKPSLIFLDYHLPDYDGYEFLQTIKSDPSLSEIPVVIISGDTSSEITENCSRIGACKYLKKPISGKDIYKIANHFVSNIKQ